MSMEEQISRAYESMWEAFTQQLSAVTQQQRSAEASPELRPFFLVKSVSIGPCVMQAASVAKLEANCESDASLTSRIETRGEVS